MGAELLATGQYGRMVSLQGLDVVSVPLEDVAEKNEICSE